MPPKKKTMTRAEFMRMKQRMESTSGRAKKKKGRKTRGFAGADKSLFQQTGEGRRTDLGQSFKPSIVFQPYINVSDIGNSYNKQYGRFQPFTTRAFRPPPPPPLPPPPQPVRNGQRLGGSNIFERMPYATTGTQTNILNTAEVGSNTLPTLNPIYRPPSGSGPTRQMMDVSRTKVGSASLSGELAVRNPNLFNLGGIPRVGAGGNRPLEVNVITGNNDGLLNPQVLDTQAQIQQSKEMGSSPGEEEKEEVDLQESKEGESVDKIVETEDGEERQETIGKLNLTRHAPLEEGHTRESIQEIRDAGLTPISPDSQFVEGMTPTQPFQPVSRPATATTMAVDPSRQQTGEPITERQETFSDTALETPPTPPKTPFPSQRSPRRLSQRKTAPDFIPRGLSPITEEGTKKRVSRDSLLRKIAQLEEQRRDLQDRPLVIESSVPPATATARQMPVSVATNVRPIFEGEMMEAQAVPKTMEDKGVGDNPVFGRKAGRPKKGSAAEREMEIVSGRDIQQGTRQEFLRGGGFPTADPLPSQDIRNYNITQIPTAPEVRFTSVDSSGQIVFSPTEEGTGMEFERD